MEEQAELLASYFEAGFEKNEYCLWIAPEALQIEKVKKKLGEAGICIESCTEKKQLEIQAAPGNEENRLLPPAMAEFLERKYEEARSKGFSGLRAGMDFGIYERTGPEKSLLGYLEAYCKALNEKVSGKNIVSLCTCPFKAFSFSETLELIARMNEIIFKKSG